MSGGPSDLLKDKRRNNYYIEYLEAIIKFIKIVQKTGEQDKKLLDNIIEAAKRIDSVSCGYYTGQTNLSRDIKEIIEKLINQDKEAWAKLLAPICSQSSGYYYIYQELKSLSPFDNKMLLYVDYGRGFVSISGEIKELIDKAIRKKEWKTYDCDEYLLAMPLPPTEDMEITWLHCGILGVDGPRPTNQK